MSLFVLNIPDLPFSLLSDIVAPIPTVSLVALFIAILEADLLLPEIVATREDGTKAVKYERICALLIESVKELKKEIEELKSGA